MTTEQHKFTYLIAGERRSVIAHRNDLAWGHAVDLEISSVDGQILNQVTFACHPEFRDFEFFQDKSTEDLLSVVIERLSSSLYESSLSVARSEGSRLFFRFNDPDGCAAKTEFSLKR